MIDDRFIGGLKVEQDFLFLIHLPTIYHYDTEGLKTQNMIDSYFFLHAWNYFVKHWIGSGLAVILTFSALLNTFGKHGASLFIMLGCRL